MKNLIVLLICFGLVFPSIADARVSSSKSISSKSSQRGSTSDGLITGAVVGGLAGAVIGSTMSSGTKSNNSTPSPSSKLSTIMCRSYDGIKCDGGIGDYKKYTPAQWVTKAGYKYMGKITTLARSEDFVIQIEVTNSKY